MAINFSFSAGQFYVLHWRPTVANTNWVTSLDYYFDSAHPVTIGPVTLIDGETGGTFPTNFGNGLHPSLRVNEVSQSGAVPEPFSLMVWVGLIAATIVSSGRRTRS